MDVGTPGEQMTFATVRKETGIRDNRDRRERCQAAAEVTGHRSKMNLAVPRENQRNRTVKFHLGLEFTDIKGRKRGDFKVQERTQVVRVLA